MVKTLRFLLMGMLVMLGMSAYAEDIIWQEDWSGVTNFDMNPNNFKSNYTFTGFVLNDDQATVKSGTKFYDANLAGGTAPELLIAKNGGSFTATINLNGKSGKMILTYKANQSITVEEITQKDQMVSEATHVGNDYEREVNVPEGTTEIQLAFTNNNSSKNARLDNIKLYQGTAKKAAGLSWGKASTTLTIGEEFTLTLSNENNLPVTYSSSKDSVATISQEGVITLKAAGKTVLTAAFAGNDEYEAQSVSVEVTVKAAEGENPNPNPNPDPDAVEATCAEIIAGTDGTVYKVKGVCTEIKNTNYGNWMLTDETGEVLIYGTLDANGQTKNFSSLGIAVGDTITVQGPKTTYNETVELVNVTVLAIAKKQGGDTPTPEIEKITVSNALQLIAELEDGKTTEKEYQVEGYVTTVDEISAKFGNATFDIADAQGGTPVLKVYRAMNAVGDKITDENMLKVDDLVIVQGKLQKYVKNQVTTPELAQGGKILTVNGIDTGITEVGTSRLQKDVIYNLRGQRVSVAKNGLYIMNGKKFFVK